MRTFLICIGIIFLFTSFADQTFDQMASKMGKGKAPFLKTKELKELQVIEKGLLILDTREPKEYKISHIKNAIYVGYDNFSISSMSKYSKSGVTIVCYCSVGYRSQKIAEKLLKSGYKKVYNLYGVIFNWVNEGNAIEDSNGNETKKIHGYSKDWSKWLTKGEKVFN